MNDDLNWLVSDEGFDVLTSWYERMKSSAGDSKTWLRTVAELRKTFSPDRATMIAEQIRLRPKVRQKFPQCPYLYASEISLQQSTDAFTAAYKADLIARATDTRQPIADLCCGIGGDLMALDAIADRLLAVDTNPQTLTLALANVKLYSSCRRGNFPFSTEKKSEKICEKICEPFSSEAGRVSGKCSPAETIDLTEYPIVHIDPDRRPSGHRTTDAEYFQPPFEAICEIIDRAQWGIVKSAPGAPIPAGWSSQGHWEWISHHGEAREAVGWFGGFTADGANDVGGKYRRKPGMRTATVLLINPNTMGTSGSVLSSIESESFTGTVEPEPKGKSLLDGGVSSLKGCCLYEPDTALLASNLCGAFARRWGLTRVCESAAYYYAPESADNVDSYLVHKYHVLDEFPLDVRTIRSALKDLGIENLTIKKRGEVPEPDVFRKLLKLPRSGPAQAEHAPFLILYPGRAVLAEMRFN